MELPLDAQRHLERDIAEREPHLELDSGQWREPQADYNSRGEPHQQQQQQQQQQPINSSAREQLSGRRTLQSPLHRIFAQPQQEDTGFLQRRRSSRLSSSSFLRTRNSNKGGPSAALSEAMSSSSKSGSTSSSPKCTPGLQKEPSAAAGPILTHQSSRSSSKNNNKSSKGSTAHKGSSTCSTQSSGKWFTSCAPWRVTLIIEAFDAGSIGCPACVPLSAAAEAAAAEENEEDAFSSAEEAAAAAAAHADYSTLPNSSPLMRSRRSSNSPRDTLSSTSSTASLPTPSSSRSDNSSSRSSGKQDSWCCSCSQLWIEVQDVRGPGAPAQLRLLSDSLLAPQHLSPPILLRRRMRQLQFRLFRRRPRQRRTLHSIELQQQHQQQQQQVEWVEERELLGMRAVSLPASRSCVISCTFGIAGCKIVAPADTSLLEHSLTLALAALHPSWDWLRLRRPDLPLPFKDVDNTTESPQSRSGLSPLCHWLRLSIRTCGSDTVAALLGAAVEGADCLRLVACDRLALSLYEP
ncbi:hypothetical protein Esti_004229 [Eimeria stiedai]